MEFFFNIIEINLENNKKEIKEKYKICGKLLNGGSSHLKRHYEHCKTKNNVDIRNYMQLGRDGSKNLTTFFYGETVCRE